MNDLSREAREIVEAGRHEEGMGDERRARNRLRLMASVGVGVAVVTTAATAASSLAPAASVAAPIAKWGFLSLVAKIGTGIVVVGALGLGARAWMNHTSAPPKDVEIVATTAAASPIVAEALPTSTAGTESADTAPPALSASSALPSTPPSSHRSARADEPSLDADMRLLRDADAALRAGHPDAAMGLLDQRQSHKAPGALAPERAAAQILTLCALGRVKEAQSRAASFLRQWPDSPLASRVRSACDAAQAPSNPGGGR